MVLTHMKKKTVMPMATFRAVSVSPKMQQQREDGQLGTVYSAESDGFEGGPDHSGRRRGRCRRPRRRTTPMAQPMSTRVRLARGDRRAPALDELQAAFQTSVGGGNSGSTAPAGRGRPASPRTAPRRAAEAEHDLGQPAAAPADRGPLRGGGGLAAHQPLFPGAVLSNDFCMYRRMAVLSAASEAWTRRQHVRHVLVRLRNSACGARRWRGAAERHGDVTDHPAGPGRHDDHAGRRGRSASSRLWVTKTTAPVLLPDLERGTSCSSRPHLRVHGRERLVHEQDLRLHGEGPAIQRPLPHTAGECGRVGLLEAAQPDPADPFHRRSLVLRRGPSRISRPNRTLATRSSRQPP